MHETIYCYSIGNELLQRNVLLLPTVHDIFSGYVDEMAQGLTINKVVSSAWILSNLTVALGKNITYTFGTRKFGTIIYRSNSDLVPALSHALWKIRNMSKGQDTDVGIEKPSQSLDVLDKVNEKAHSRIKTLLSQCTEHPYEYDKIDIDKMIEDTDPTLWGAVCKLTRSQNERRGRVHDPLSSAYHNKKVRRFYLLCVICYCINDRCSMPFHTLIADLVEGQGGSALLIKILNRLGVCASADTLARFIQYRVSSQENRPIMCHNPYSFTVVSADNIDFMHSYARVFQGKQNSSWHGTSIQVVQPLPSLEIDEIEMDLTSSTVRQPSLPLDNIQLQETASSPVHTGNTYVTCITEVATYFLPDESDTDYIRITNTRKRQRRSSPIQSPLKITRSPASKLSRRFRTGTEHNPISVRTSSLTQSSTHSFSKGERNTLPNRISRPKTLSDYQMNDSESLALKELMEEISVYMFGKVSLASQQPESILFNLQDYFSIGRPNHTEQSNVHYLRVMDAVADKWRCYKNYIASS